jgi:hypothetical protein
VWGDEAAVAAKVKELVAAAGKTLEASRGARIEQIDKHYGVTFPDGEPALAGFGGWKVVKAKGATLAIEKDQLEHYSYGCVETRKIDRIENGKVYYQQRCKSGESVFELSAEVTFAELPPGTTFAPGDVIHFSADIQSDIKKVVKDTAPKKLTRRKLVLAGRHVGVIERGRDKIMW